MIVYIKHLKVNKHKLKQSNINLSQNKVKFLSCLQTSLSFYLYMQLKS